MKNLLVCFLLIAVPCGSVQAAWSKNAKSISALSFLWREINKSRLGMAMLGAGALSATIYGTGKLYHWWVAKNDIQCLQEARSALAQVTSDYKDILSDFDIPSVPRVDGSVEGDPYEPRLRAFAELYICKNGSTENANSIDGYLRNLNAAIIWLETHRATLNNKVGSAGRALKQAHHEMRDLAEQLLAVHGKLKTIHDFLRPRSEYFKLYEVEKVYSARYGDEVGFAMISKDNQRELTENVHRVVMVYNSFIRDAFPYCRYVRDAATAISTIQSRVARQERQYPECVRSLRTILDSLRTVQGVAAISPHYLEETRREEESRLLNEATAVERAKVAALGRQAQVKEQKVLAIQAQNAAMHAHTFALNAQNQQLELFRQKYGTHDIVGFLRSVSQLLSGRH